MRMNITKRLIQITTIVVIVAVCVSILCGCMSFASAPQGISEDSRTFKKIKDQRMYAEAPDYKGYIFKDGVESFCFRFKTPTTIEEGKAYPLVVFLHGMGDYGDDNSSHMYRSLIDSIAEYAPEDCYVFIPQGITNRDWSDNGIMTGKGGMDALYNKCLEQLIEDYNIDTNRIYLTGMSMGGHGTIWQATNHPDKYAALMPVCGLFYWDDGTAIVDKLETLKDMPIWLFHSKNDATVRFNNSTKLISELDRVGNTNYKARWFVVPAHDITTYAYDSQEVWQWLFSQKRTV